MDTTSGQYWNQIDYILYSQRWKNSIQSAKARPGADCGSEHQLFTAKFRLKSKKVGETTRPFRYGLNQIAYNYTVEVTNRSKKLDLIYRVPGELWTKVHNTVQEAVIKTISRREISLKMETSGHCWWYQTGVGWWGGGWERGKRRAGGLEWEGGGEWGGRRGSPGGTGGRVRLRRPFQVSCRHDFIREP